MNLGKVDLGDEAQWPGAIADLPKAFPAGLKPFVNTLPVLCAEESVEPMEGTKDNAIRQNGSIFNGSIFHVERRPERPIDIWRQIGLAAEVACADWRRVSFFDRARNENDAMPGQFGESWRPFSQPRSL